jgi:hypothetical protein
MARIDTLASALGSGGLTSAALLMTKIAGAISDGAFAGVSAHRSLIWDSL